MLLSLLCLPLLLRLVRGEGETPCSQGCLICQDFGLASEKCLSCDNLSGYYLSFGSCASQTINNCLFSSERGVCSICEYGYYLTGDFRCAAIPNRPELRLGSCNFFDRIDQCIACDMKTYIRNGLCRPISEPVGNCTFYQNHKACQICNLMLPSYNQTHCALVPSNISHCLMYRHPITCKKCKPGFEIDYNYHVRAVPSFQKELFTTLKFWREQFFQITFSTPVCKQSYSIAHCKTLGYNKTCVACEVGYTLSPNSTLCFQKSMPPQDPTLRIPSCFKFASDNYETCAICYEGYYLTNSASKCVTHTNLVPNCMTMSQSANSVCAFCDNPYLLQTFQDGSTTCTSRDHFFNNCQYYNRTGDNCISCAPEHLFHNNRTRCSKRIPNCLVHNIDGVILKCSDCENEFYLDSFNTTCIDANQVLEGCYKYTQNANCQICSQGYYLNTATQKCVVQGQFIDCLLMNINTPNVCDTCVQPSARTFRIDQCTFVSKTVLSQNPNCVQFNNMQVCSKCASDYVLYTNSTGTYCESFPFCVSLADISVKNNCSVCTTGYYAYNGQCISTTLFGCIYSFSLNSTSSSYSFLDGYPCELCQKGFMYRPGKPKDEFRCSLRKDQLPNCLNYKYYTTSSNPSDSYSGCTECARGYYINTAASNTCSKFSDSLATPVYTSVRSFDQNYQYTSAQVTLTMMNFKGKVLSGPAGSTYDITAMTDANEALSCHIVDSTKKYCLVCKSTYVPYFMIAKNAWDSILLKAGQYKHISYLNQPGSDVKSNEEKKVVRWSPAIYGCQTFTISGVTERRMALRVVLEDLAVPAGDPATTPRYNAYYLCKAKPYLTDSGITVDETTLTVTVRETSWAAQTNADPLKIFYTYTSANANFHPFPLCDDAVTIDNCESYVNSTAHNLPFHVSWQLSCLKCKTGYNLVMTNYTYNIIPNAGGRLGRIQSILITNKCLPVADTFPAVSNCFVFSTRVFFGRQYQYCKNCKPGYEPKMKVAPYICDPASPFGSSVNKNGCIDGYRCTRYRRCVRDCGSDCNDSNINQKACSLNAEGVYTCSDNCNGLAKADEKCVNGVIVKRCNCMPAGYFVCDSSTAWKCVMAKCGSPTVSLLTMKDQWEANTVDKTVIYDNSNDIAINMDDPTIGLSTSIQQRIDQLPNLLAALLDYKTKTFDSGIDLTAANGNLTLAIDKYNAISDIKVYICAKSALYPKFNKDCNDATAALATATTYRQAAQDSYDTAVAMSNAIAASTSSSNNITTLYTYGQANYTNYVNPGARLLQAVWPGDERQLAPCNCYCYSENDSGCTLPWQTCCSLNTTHTSLVSVKEFSVTNYTSFLASQTAYTTAKNTGKTAVSATATASMDALKTQSLKLHNYNLSWLLIKWTNTLMIAELNAQIQAAAAKKSDLQTLQDKILAAETLDLATGNKTALEALYNPILAAMTNLTTLFNEVSTKKNASAIANQTAANTAYGPIKIIYDKAIGYHTSIASLETYAASAEANAVTSKGIAQQATAATKDDSLAQIQDLKTLATASETSSNAVTNTPEVAFKAIALARITTALQSIENDLTLVNAIDTTPSGTGGTVDPVPPGRRLQAVESFVEPLLEGKKEENLGEELFVLPKELADLIEKNARLIESIARAAADSLAAFNERLLVTSISNSGTFDASTVQGCSDRQVCSWNKCYWRSLCCSASRYCKMPNLDDPDGNKENFICTPDSNCSACNASLGQFCRFDGSTASCGAIQRALLATPAEIDPLKCTPNKYELCTKITEAGKTVTIFKEPCYWMLGKLYAVNCADTEVCIDSGCYPSTCYPECPNWQTCDSSNPKAPVCVDRPIDPDVIELMECAAIANCDLNNSVNLDTCDQCLNTFSFLSEYVNGDLVMTKTNCFSTGISNCLGAIAVPTIDCKVCTLGYDRASPTLCNPTTLGCIEYSTITDTPQCRFCTSAYYTGATMEDKAVIFTSYQSGDCERYTATPPATKNPLTDENCSYFKFYFPMGTADQLKTYQFSNGIQSCITCNPDSFMANNDVCLVMSINNCVEYDVTSTYGNTLCKTCEVGFQISGNKKTCTLIQPPSDRLASGCLYYNPNNTCAICDPSQGLVAHAVKMNTTGWNFKCFKQSLDSNCLTMNMQVFTNTGNISCTSCRQIQGSYAYPAAGTQYICMPVVQQENCEAYDDYNFTNSTFNCKKCSSQYFLNLTNNLCTQRSNTAIPNCIVYSPTADDCLTYYTASGSNLGTVQASLSADIATLLESPPPLQVNQTAVSFGSWVMGCEIYSDPSTCYRCYAHKYLNPYGIDYNTKCVPVNNPIPYCRFYDNDGVSCVECQPFYLLYNGKCQLKTVENCGAYANPNLCATCILTFPLVDQEGHCTKDPLNQWCETYESVTGSQAGIITPCDTCQTGFYPDDASICRAVSRPVYRCLYYADDGLCKACVPGYYLDFNGEICRPNPTFDPNCDEFGYGTECGLCEMGYFIKNGSCVACENAPDGCAYCDPLDNTKCLMCRFGYSTTASGCKKDPKVDKPEQIIKNFFYINNVRTAVSAVKTSLASQQLLLALASLLFALILA